MFRGGGGGQINSDNLALFKQFSQFLEFQKSASASVSEAGPSSTPLSASVSAAVPIYSLAPTALPRFSEPNPLASRGGRHYNTTPLRVAHTSLAPSLHGGVTMPTSRALCPPPGPRLINQTVRPRGQVLGTSFGERFGERGTSMASSDHLLGYQENIDSGHFGYSEFSGGHYQPLESDPPEDLVFSERVSESEGGDFQDWDSKNASCSELGVQADALLIRYLGDLYCPVDNFVQSTRSGF